MKEKPDFGAELKGARARGDKEGMREVMRMAAAWTKANPKVPITDVRDALTKARAQKDVPEAERVIVAALEQKNGHLLDADDLLWVVSEVGARKSSWRAGQAIAAWLFHHGPVHRGVVEVAEEIAAHDNAEWLDRMLLWIEPTPYRWYQHACWFVMQVGDVLEGRLKHEGREASEDLNDPEIAALYNRCVVEVFSEHARWVVQQRGAAALRSLRAAPDEAEAGSQAKLILDAWKEALT